MAATDIAHAERTSAPPDLEAIASLYERLGGMLSCYFDAVPDDDSSPDDVLSRWRRQLLRIPTDLPAGLRAGVDRALTVPESAGGLAVIVDSSDGVTERFELPDPPLPHIEWGNLVFATPLIAAAQSLVTHATVVVDADGIDVVRSAADGAATTTSIEVDPDDPADLRRAVRRGVGHGGDLRLVVVAAPAAQLPIAASAFGRSLTCQVVEFDLDEPGAADDVDALADTVVRQSATVVANDTVALLERFRDHRAVGGAAQGAAATVAALRAGDVEVLLLHDDARSDRTLWVTDDPARLELEPAPGLVPARFGDALARAALLAGAEVRMVPTTGAGGPLEDVGAILRTGTTSSSLHQGSTADCAVPGPELGSDAYTSKTTSR